LVCLDVEGFPIESHLHLAYRLGKHLSVTTRAFMEFARLEARKLVSDRFSRPVL